MTDFTDHEKGILEKFRYIEILIDQFIKTHPLHKYSERLEFATQLKGLSNEDLATLVSQVVEP